ncbi:CPXCG motif-containing cysteine-rich protein [Ketobacter sp. MCCC 1A13808]|uniref:CPXCG motif-containing cysteine-rich protein n=1 Tax=Ketobacter sp. MCCC 1A13808 TaxID=2602738 RepID=UPI000F181ED4|nr:CPXCG motif-containing cysteine-rich protein [Ketobacter sp. MCCC 1A13808]MVF12194.1 CPXCG motif-containing cysteine-rich protein [Ketobacter sp. MCCC 1A13808]RLP53735.1 MAG: CPXCG motif-containing cysteine-rich protein [Ketobacter sp.]
MLNLEEIALFCPYCGESIQLLIDCSVEEQTYTEDCQVCCQPMLVGVVVDESEEGQVAVHLRREDE